MPESHEPPSLQPGPPIARLLVKMNADWPVQDISEASRGSIYQTIPGISGSLVFVRWGAGETLENYVGPLGGSGWTATVEEEEMVTHLGLPARRLRIALEQGGAEEFRETSRPDSSPSAYGSPQRLIIVVISLMMCGLPALLGYRLPAAALREWAPQLEQILATVSCEG